MEKNQGYRAFYAETYDLCVSDWPGEIEFYRAIVRQTIRHEAGSVLELACGTGRVTLRLADGGVSLVGLDRSPDMLSIAQEKSVENPHIRWVEGDMRSFNLSETFDVVLIPGHSFQNLNDPNDQNACLECTNRHLKPGGVLVVHLDHMNAENMQWLGEISAEEKGKFNNDEQFTRPSTGNQVQTKRAWSYEPAAQTATVQTIWEEIRADGEVIHTWDTGPIRLHCVFRFEMEHLLKRAGFEIESIYGDFSGGELRDDSTDLIWVARKPV